MGRVRFFDEQHPKPPSRVDARGRRVDDVHAIRAAQLEKDKQVQPASVRRPSGVVGTISTASSPRIRQAVERLGIDNETSQDPVLDYYFDKYKKEQKEKERVAKEQEGRERAEQNRRAESARIAQAHEAARQRDADLLKREAERVARIPEESLIRSQIIALCESANLSLEEVAAIGSRLKRDGTWGVLMCWESEIVRLKGGN